MAEERAFWLAWSQMNGIGPVLLRRLHRHFGTLADAWQASPADLLEVEGFGLQTADVVASARQTIQPERLLEQHQIENPHFCTPADPDYPRLLLEIPDSPPVLYYRGQWPPSMWQGHVPTVAIVGTRSPSPYGKDATRKLATALTQQGFAIVSGLAAGIDTEAHRSCLAVNGYTIAVLGCAVDVIYPWSNKDLYQQIVESGVVVSEYPAGTQPDRTYFPRRNRIIAGLSRATLVMEAPEKSGGLITAHYANDYGRDVYALPGRITDTTSFGCLRLIQAGAGIIISPSQLIESLSAMPGLAVAAEVQSPGVQTALPLNLAPDLSQVLQAIADLAQTNDAGSVLFDHLVEQTQLPTSTVTSALLQLELEGLITQLPGMRYQRC
jgi:DNA processing protein